MAADESILEKLPVHQQLHSMGLVIHQTHDADGAWMDVQVFQQKALVGKGQPGAAQLGGKILGAELFVAGHHQQIECGLLPVAQEQILAHLYIQGLIDGQAVFHGHSGGMVDALIGDVQPIQQPVGTQFPFLAGKIFHGASSFLCTLEQIQVGDGSIIVPEPMGRNPFFYFFRVYAKGEKRTKLQNPFNKKNKMHS